jgi:hypothetical protein
MPYDPLMRWENEGGAVLAASDGRRRRPVSPGSNGNARRGHDPREHHALAQTDRIRSVRRRRRALVAA